jgi:tetratricopeptide (TPR) repeat protein
MNSNRENVDQLILKAYDFYKKKDLPKAEDYCRKALKINPEHYDSISLLATIFAVSKNFVKAKELMILAVKIDPKNTSSLNNLGTAHKQLGEYKEAINIYKEVLKFEPNHINANYNIGLVFYDLRELKKAKAYLKKTVEIKKDYANAFFSLGNVHADLKEFNQALSCYQKTLEINPNFIAAHNNIGLVYRELNDFKNAISSYENAIKVKPDHVNAHHNLALALKELGDFDKSIKSHEMAIKYEPSNLMNYHFLSELKKEILDDDLESKINSILSSPNLTLRNAAYGNYLLAKYEKSKKNYKKEMEHLIKGHESFYNMSKNKFNLGIKYCFDDVLQIVEGGKVSKSSKKSKSEINPIFILGVPRSGSTLIERIISSGKNFIPIGEETGVIGNYIPMKVMEKQSLNLGYANDLADELFEIYKSRNLIFKEHNFTFTDKSLDNFFYMEFISEIFPNAKIIHCKRKPLSSIMSIFQNNLTSLAWTHNLDNIFKYFDNCFEIIQTYKESEPNNIYEINFENLVDNPTEESKELMNFCNLPWDKKCLEFHKRKDLFSKTASNIQIRKAIYKHSEEKYLPYNEILKKYGKNYSWFN